MEKVLIIIPAYNEEKNLPKLTEKLEKMYPQYDYVVVNDGSEDYTKELCRKEGISVINLPVNLGIGGAVQTGYKYGSENGYDIAVQIDGDGQHDIAYLDKLLEPLRNNSADVVIGSRFIRKEGFQSSRLRRTGIVFLSRLIRVLTGVRVYDVTSGFRAVNRRFVEIYARDYPSDYPEPEAIVSAIMEGGRVLEVPVVMKERESGTSSINLVRSVYYMIKVTLAVLLSRFAYGRKVQ